MRGEEVSREIPFIFSRPFADTRPGSAWGERERILSAAGKEEAPGRLPQGRMLVPSWKSHMGWMVWRWAGQVTAVTPRMGDGQLGLALVPLCSSAGHWDPPQASAVGQRGTPTPHSARDTQVPALGAGGSAQLVTRRFLGTGHCPSVTPESSECQRDLDWCCPILERPEQKPIPISARPGNAAKAEPDSAPGLLGQEKISWHEHNKRQILPSLFGKNLLSGGEGGSP